MNNTYARIILIPVLFLTSITTRQLTYANPPINTRDAHTPLHKSINTYSNKKNIWIHAAHTSDIVSIQTLTDHIKKRFPDLELFVSTITPETKKAADLMLRADNIKVIPYDNLQKLAQSISNINPKVIVFIHHEFLPNLILLANLNNIPMYLIGAEYAHKTERLIETAPYLYIPLLNSFKHIFTRTLTDTQTLQEIGITLPDITTGDPLLENGIITENLDFFFTSLERDLNTIKTA
ncbi:MAG: glycosyltransferase N-terminal domain-containing protein [bacterium]